MRPLKQAKRHYCFGDFISTIAVCGVAIEMLAIFIHKLNGQKVTDQELDKMHQFERVNQAVENNWINANVKEEFDKVSYIRKKHLHWWSTKLDEIQNDAKEMYLKTFELYKKVKQISVSNGQMIIRQNILDFLKRESS